LAIAGAGCDDDGGTTSQIDGGGDDDDDGDDGGGGDDGSSAQFCATCPSATCDVAVDGTAIGEVTVPLDIAEDGTRARETAVGNLFADAYKWYQEDQGMPVDIAMVGGGGIRCSDEFDQTQCDGYCLAPGPLTVEELDIVLKFSNPMVVKEVTCDQLRSTLERAVSVVPGQKKGWFLHYAGLSFTADCSKTPQILNVDETAIDTEGERVIDFTINGEACDPGRTYLVATGEFLAAGNDGHLAIAEAQTTPMGWEERDAITAYVTQNSPVTPATEGRINLMSNCCVGCTP
jgi:5'-nucleotidase